MSNTIQLEVTAIELAVIEEALGFWAQDDAQCVAPFHFSVAKKLIEALESKDISIEVESTPEATEWRNLHAECETCGNWVPKKELKTCDEQKCCPECLEIFE